MQVHATTSATATHTMADKFLLSVKKFAGLDQRAGCSSTIEAFPTLTNFRVNQSGYLEKRGGYGLIYEGVGGKVTQLWNKSGKVFAARRRTAFRLEDGKFVALGDADSDVTGFFEFYDRVYALGGNIYHADTEYLQAVKGYTPIVATACSPDGAGTLYEKVNLINPNRRVQFNGDGTSLVYTLPETNIDAISDIKINGVHKGSGFYFHPSSNLVEFEEAPPEGINNVEISYCVHENPEESAMIYKCRFATVFENRLFLYGNPDYPNYVFHSDTANGMPSAEYFTPTGYHVFDKPVSSLVACYNRLLMFCEDCAYYTYSELKTDSLGRTYASFPLFELNAGKGSLAKGNMPTCNNEPITLCDDGINRWSSTAIADERTAMPFSERVYKHIAVLKEHKDELVIINRKARSELWFAVDTGVLIYNYAADCFYYYAIPHVSALCEHGEGVLLGIGTNIYLHNDSYTDDNGEQIKAEFATPYCTFGAPYNLKSLNGAGLSVESGGELLGNLTVQRGNLTEEQGLKERFVLPAIEQDGCRLVRCRLHLKRFYSCKLVFYTYSPKLCITELCLFGKQLTGFTRNN